MLATIQYHAIVSVFVFSLRFVVVYTAVEEIHFSPLWVDGLR
jgi:hypothetical protein